MITPEGRLWAGSGCLIIGGPCTWHIADFDQRRHFSVTYCPPKPVEDRELTEAICLAKLRRHLDDLGVDILGFHFSDPDGPITLTTDPDDDITLFANNRPLSSLDLPFSVKTISVTKLTELDRMGPEVDLVTYPEDPAVEGITWTKAAFKYWFIHNGMFRKWYELQCWSRLPRDHPHIVPFDAVVIDDAREGVVGFTSLYIPGGTLLDNNATSRPFRLQWLQQLCSVIDDLNYRYGVMHQDIAARNLLIDDKENLRIFDFNYSIMIKEHYAPEHDDIKGVIFTLYEIITLDEQFRKVPPAEQDAEALLRLDWAKHPDVRLDSTVQAFREILDTWVSKRKTRAFNVVDSCIHWPWMSDDPEGPILVKGPDGIQRKQMKSVPVLSRREMAQMKEPYFDWERPASYRLKDALERKGLLEKGDATRGRDAVEEKVVMGEKDSAGERDAAGERDVLEIEVAEGKRHV